MPFKILLKVLKGIFWSFLGEKILAKLVWMFLAYAAKQTSNGIDDKAVAEAKKAYYSNE